MVAEAGQFEVAMRLVQQLRSAGETPSKVGADFPSLVRMCCSGGSCSYRRPSCAGTPRGEFTPLSANQHTNSITHVQMQPLFHRCSPLLSSVGRNAYKVKKKLRMD